MVTPEPTDDELAAILAAYEVLWPRPSGTTRPVPASQWRFAGRPWRRRARYGGWC